MTQPDRNTQARDDEMVIDRIYGLFYGIELFSGLCRLWDAEYCSLLQCIRLAVRLAVEDTHAGIDTKSRGFSYFSDRLAGCLDTQSHPYSRRIGHDRFALSFYTALLYKLITSEMHSFRHMEETVDSLLHEAVDCDSGNSISCTMLSDCLNSYCQDNKDQAMKIPDKRNMSSFDAVKFSLWILYYQWHGSPWPLSLKYIIDTSEKFFIETSDISLLNIHLPEARPDIMMLGCMAGAMIGRHYLVRLERICRLTGKSDIGLSLKIAHIQGLPLKVPDVNEGFFTNILIVSDDIADESGDLADYLSLKYPNASVFTLYCDEDMMKSYERISETVYNRSVDLIIAMRGVAPIVCRQMNIAKLLIFPVFRKQGNKAYRYFDSDLLLKDITMKEKGLTYGVLSDGRCPEHRESVRFYKEAYVNCSGYFTDVVNTMIIDDLSYNIWSLCPNTVLPSHIPKLF